MQGPYTFEYTKFVVCRVINNVPDKFGQQVYGTIETILLLPRVFPKLRKKLFDL